MTITVLMYHQVGRFGPVTAHRSLYCDAGAFRRQMAFLRAGRYHILSVDEVLDCVEGRKDIPPRAVHLTFDDGYMGFSTVALPAMRHHRIPSSVYMVAGLIGKEAGWLAADGLPAPPLMDAETLRRVDSEGARVGSHTVSHARLSRLLPEDLRRETAESRAALEGVLRREVRDFCYPYGDVSQDAVAAVRAAGYRLAFTCERNRASRGSDSLLLPRHAVSYGTSLAGLWWKLHLQKPGRPLAL